MKLLILLTMMLGASFANAICFHDKQSYQDVRAKLPPLMRQGTLTLVHTSKNLLAGMRFFASGSQFKIESHLWHSWMGMDQSEGVVREICVEGTTAEVVMQTGTKQDLLFQGSQVKIKNYPFKQGTMQDFQKVVNQIAVKAEQ